MDEQIDKFVDLIFDFNMKDLEDETKLLENYKKLQQQNQKYKEVIDKLKKHCEIEINASSHYLENHCSQKELCHKVAHQRVLDILKEADKEVK